MQTVWAQCLLDDSAVNVTDKVTVYEKSIAIDGLLLRKLGHKAGEKTEVHEPSLIVKIF